MIRNPVQQSGSVTPGHLSKWITDSVIADAGIPPTTLTLPQDGTFITATGSTTPRTLANRFSSPFPFNVLDYGAVGDGSTDNTAAIQAAINAAASAGGGTVLFGPGTYNFSSTLLVSTSYISLLGCAAGGIHDVGSNPTPTPTILNWTGSSGPMVSFASPAGASNRCQEGGGMTGFWFSGNSLANIGLSILSWRAGLFQELFFLDCAQFGLDMNCLITGSTLGEAADNQYNRFINIESRNFVATSGGLMRLDGSSNANTSFNTLINCTAQFANAVPFELRNCDNNYFQNVGGVRGGGGSAAYLMRLEAGPTWNAGGNIIDHFSCSQPIFCAGTPTGTQPSADNVILNIDSGNGAPAPTIETGASCYFNFTSGVQERMPIVQGAFGESAANSLNALSKVLGTVVSLLVYNTAQAHLELTDSTNTWVVRIDGSNNLNFVQTAGGTSTLSCNNFQATFYVATAAAVAALPNVTTYKGARATVTDSTVAASGNFGAVVTGGGGNVVPVYSDGTNWRIG